mgnify:CR=1 FL=1
MRYFSMHIPKTGGTAFYDWLCHQFKDVSVNVKRDMVKYESFTNLLDCDVVHGHVKFREIAPYLTGKEKLIVWVRNPIDRVISNYYFFKNALQNPLRPQSSVAQANAHRKDETLIHYAMRPETQNMISDYLEGVSLDSLYFIGSLESFETDIYQLSNQLSHTNRYYPGALNQGEKFGSQNISYEELELLKELNQKDILIYNQLMNLRKSRLMQQMLAN